MSSKKPLSAELIEINVAKSSYPEPFADLMEGRVKRKIGDYFGLSNFGVNLTELAPGAMSALKHHHKLQDEFIYVVSGTPTLVFGNDGIVINPGDCFGFPKGGGIGHQLVNRSEDPVVFLEIGDRTPMDEVEYPDDDLKAKSLTDGSWVFLHKDGSSY